MDAVAASLGGRYRDGGEDLAQDMRVQGYSEEDIDKALADRTPEPFLLHADNARSWQLFAVSLSQARWGPMGGFIGLDYPGVEAAARMAGIEVTPEIFADLRLMEAEAVGAMARR